MEKILVGLVIGLLGGAALGAFVVAPMVKGGADAGVEAAEKAKAEKAETLEQHTEDLNVALRNESRKRADAEREARNAAEQVTALKERTEQAERKYVELKAKAEGRGAAAAGTGPTGAGGAGTAATDGGAALKLDPAVAREKGKALREKIVAAIDSKDKATVIAAMKELRELGEAAYPEFYEAWVKVEAVGNAFTRRNNTLGLSMPEFAGLMTRELQDYALKDPNGDVPLGARISSAWGLPWDSSKTNEEKVQLLGAALKSSTDPNLANAAISNMGQINDPAAVPYLTETARNSSYPPETRADAVEALAGFGEQSDWETINQLANDPDPKVAAAARGAQSAQNPGATGFMVTNVMETSFDGQPGQARAVGIVIGDIITRYNGEPVTDRDTLIGAAGRAPKDVLVTVEVWRGGSVMAFQVKAGPLSIDGRAVVKK